MRESSRREWTASGSGSVSCGGRLLTRKPELDGTWHKLRLNSLNADRYDRAMSRPVHRQPPNKHLKLAGAHK